MTQLILQINLYKLNYSEKLTATPHGKYFATIKQCCKFIAMLQICCLAIFGYFITEEAFAR